MCEGCIKWMLFEGQCDCGIIQSEVSVSNMLTTLHHPPPHLTIHHADPLTYTEPTRVRVAQQYLIATENIRKRMDAVCVPLLIFHSELDTMCDADGSKQLYLAAKVCVWCV